MKKRRKSVAVLISSGLDSAILLAQTLKTHTAVYPVYIAGGNFWEKAEENHLRIFLRKIQNKRLKPLTILSMPLKDIYKNHWSMTGKKSPSFRSPDKAVYLPGKNLLLIAKTAIFCTRKKIQNIALAPLKTNPFPDATRSFFDHYESVLSKGLNFRIKIATPFLLHTKKEVLKKGKGLPLKWTFSCIHPVKNQHCGRCNKCAERKSAFRLVGVKDPTKYAG